MPSFVAYQKYIDAQVTRELRLPDDVNGQKMGQELCTIDGLTYVALPDGAVLPAAQPEGITALPVTLTPALLDQIKTVSAQARFIQSVIDSSGPEPYSDESRVWAAAEKARLGL